MYIISDISDKTVRFDVERARFEVVRLTRNILRFSVEAE